MHDSHHCPPTFLSMLPLICLKPFCRPFSNLSTIDTVNPLAMLTSAIPAPIKPAPSTLMFLMSLAPLKGFFFRAVCPKKMALSPERRADASGQRVRQQTEASQFETVRAPPTVTLHRGPTRTKRSQSKARAIVALSVFPSTLCEDCQRVVPELSGVSARSAKPSAS